MNEKKELIKNPILRNALENIKISCNQATGILHPSDRATVIIVFKTLKQYHIKVSLENVRKWLVIEGGFSSKDAMEIVTIAHKIFIGKQVRGLKGYSGKTPKKIFDSWKIQD